MISQEEITVRLGLDTRDFDRRLREADQTARKYANRTGAALNTGSPEGGHVPQSWQNIGNLSRQSQDLIRQRGGLAGVFDTIAGGVGRINPSLGSAIGNLTMFGLGMKGISLAKGEFHRAMGVMQRAFLEVKEASDLDVSTSFLRDFKRAADATGESADEAKGRVLRFQQVLASAAEGGKEALEKLGRVGIKDPTGKTMEENLRDVANGLSNISDKAQQAKAAVELFGKGAQTSMPDILAELGSGKRNMQAEEDTATMAAGWKSAKGLWSRTGGKAMRGLRDTASFYGAGILSQYFGIEGEVNDPSTLQKTESAEAKAAREAKTKKHISDLTAARMEYNRAVVDGYDTETKARSVGLDLIKITHRLKTEKMDELEKTKLQTEQLQKQNQLNELNAQIAERQKQIDGKRLQYAILMAKLAASKNDLKDDATKAKSDRSGWTVGDVVNLKDKFQAAHGNGQIVPQDMLDTVQRSLGRQLSRKEVLGLREGADKAMNTASNIADLENASKFLRLAGMGDTADQLTDKALATRKDFDALTSGESDPMTGFSKSMESIDKNMADLTAAALRDGIIIKPRMGK
jgi:molecular chaperone GrpE (heat shock protein)